MIRFIVLRLYLKVPLSLKFQNVCGAFIMFCEFIFHARLFIIEFKIHNAYE